MKPAFTFLTGLLFGLAMVLLTVQAQAQKLESFASSTGTYYYTATYMNDNYDSDYTRYVNSNPNSGIFVVDSGNGNYNCHAFAWPNDTTVWVQPNYTDTAAPPIYYNDTTLYYKITADTDAEIAVYGDPTGNPIHSALRLTDSNSTNPFARAFLSKYPQYVGWYISKWDGGPLVIHQVDSCPFYRQANEQVTFYKKRSDASGSNYLQYSGSDYSIIGPPAVCSSGTQFKLGNASGSDTINFFPPAITVSWSCSSHVTLSPDSTAYPITATTSTSGRGEWIRATLHFPDGTTDTVKRVWLWSGIPTSISAISTSQWGNEVNPVSQYGAEFYAWIFTTADLDYPDPIDLHGVSTYTWSSSPLTYYLFSSTINYRYAAGNFSGTGNTTITVHGSNACGSTSMYQEVEVNSDDFLYTMSPNPASDMLSVNITPATTVTQTTPVVKGAAISGTGPSGVPVTYTLKIVDLSGTLYYTSTQTGNKFTIPVGNLNAGNYIVILSDGKRATSKNLVVQH